MMNTTSLTKMAITTVPTVTSSCVNKTSCADNMTEVEYSDYLEYKIMVQLETYLPPCFLLLSLIGNSLAFIVFSQKSFSRTASSVLYRTLAMADTTCVLNIDLLHFIPITLGYTSLLSYNTVTCKVTNYLYFAANAISSWMLVLVGLERAIGVTLPHRAAVLCTKQKFTKVMVFVLVLLAVVYSPLIYTSYRFELAASVDAEHVTAYCMVGTDGFAAHYSNANLISSSVLPFVLILAANVVIITCLILAARRRKVSSSSKSATSDLTNMVAMLLTVSFVFIILTIPNTVYLMIEPLYRDNPLSIQYVRIILLGSVAILCNSLNHSINILLYCAAGSKFRSALYALILCRKTKAPLPRSSTMSRSSKALTDTTSETARY